MGASLVSIVGGRGSWCTNRSQLSSQAPVFQVTATLHEADARAGAGCVMGLLHGAGT